MYPITFETAYFRWDREHHVHMVGHQMPFFDPALFLFGELVERLTKAYSQLAIQRLPSAFRDKHFSINARSRPYCAADLSKLEILRSKFADSVPVGREPAVPDKVDIPLAHASKRVLAYGAEKSELMRRSRNQTIMAFLFPYDVCCSKTKHHAERKRREQIYLKIREEQIQGVLAGFDRLVFRSTLRSIVYDAAMKSYLWRCQVLRKDFGKHVEQTSRQWKAASLQAAGQAGKSSEPAVFTDVPSSVRITLLVQSWCRDVADIASTALCSAFPDGASDSGH